VRTNVAIEDEVRLLVEKSAEKYGRLNYALINAGRGEIMLLVLEQTADNFDQIMNANDYGLWLSMKYEFQRRLDLEDDDEFLR
jgi:NAD(P)-dependent dehydrogenase (short-subunit alcohol dehydrogenase family)